METEPQSLLVYNPSLRLVPRHEPADVISSQKDSSLIDWLETSGRMLPRDPSETDSNYLGEEEEISELIAVDDNFNDDDDDDVEDDSEQALD
ncbi:MAG: DUF3134 domain-containing protein [Microcoleaceae cyanobacterium MO_207.B10]|nr:DUF3134 domain-containing protein [Microcoleaceae cyanobacterium MO_207.B10]